MLIEKKNITKSKRKYLIIGIGTNLVSNPITNNFTSTNILNETNKKPSLLLYKKRLINLYEILDKDDDVIFKWYSNKNPNDSIPINKVSDLLKKFRVK